VRRWNVSDSAPFTMHCLADSSPRKVPEKLLHGFLATGINFGALPTVCAFYFFNHLTYPLSGHVKKKMNYNFLDFHRLVLYIGEWF